MADNLSPVQELAALREAGVTAKAEISRLAGELSAATALNTEAQGQITALTTERDAARAEGNRLTGELATATTNLSAVTGERDTAQAALAKANKRLESPSAEAAAICAAAGVDALAIRPGVDAAAASTKSRDALFAEMNAIEDPQARAQFYDKHLSTRR